MQEKASQSSPPEVGEEGEIIFSGSAYVGENTAQSASVRIVRPWRAVRAHSRLQTKAEAAIWQPPQKSKILNYSTVTDLARLRGISTSQPRASAI